MIRSIDGRYQILLANGDVVIMNATQDDIDTLYRKLISRGIFSRTFMGFGWVSREDHQRLPVTGDVRTYL